jgi:hypothetical protein
MGASVFKGEPAEGGSLHHPGSAQEGPGPTGPAQEDPGPALTYNRHQTKPLNHYFHTYV